MAAATTTTAPKLKTAATEYAEAESSKTDVTAPPATPSKVSDARMRRRLAFVTAMGRWLSGLTRCPIMEASISASTSWSSRYVSRQRTSASSRLLEAVCPHIT